MSQALQEVFEMLEPPDRAQNLKQGLMSVGWEKVMNGMDGNEQRFDLRLLTSGAVFGTSPEGRMGIATVR